MPRYQGRKKPIELDAVIEVLRSQAAIRTMIGQSERALIALERGLFLSRALGDKLFEAKCLQGMALAHGALDRYRDTIKYAGESIEAYKYMGDDRGVAENLTLCGNMYYWMGERKKAYEMCRQAMKIQEFYGDITAIAENLMLLGMLEDASGNTRGQLECYQKAYALLAGSDNKTAIGLALNNLGHAYSVLDDFKTAMEHYQSALVFQKESGDLVNQAQIIYNMGYLLFKQSNYREAAENFACALALYGKMGNSTDSAWALTGIGRARLAMGEMEKAADDLATAAAMAMKAGDENILCRIEMTKAELKLARGLPERARPHIEAVGKAAEIYKARGTMAKALALQAQCEEEYDAAAAEIHYKEAAAIFREYNMTYDLAETCLKLARFSATLNKKEDIDQSLKVAEEIFTMMGNQRYLDEISRIRSLT